MTLSLLANKMTTIERIMEHYPEEEFLKADGFDEAIMGVDYTSQRLVYSVTKCLEILEEEMDSEEALEYFLFNVEGSYVGEQTPIWCWEI